MQDISGQVVWVTGAGTGIGEAGAIRLAEAGCRVVLSGRRPEPLEAVRGTIEAAGGEAVVEPLDVSRNTDVEAVAGRIVERFGRIDIGVFSAGINVPKRNWADVTPDLWDQVIGIDLDGAFYCCAAVVPIMRRQGGGLIINVSSMAGKGVSALTGPAYGAAKHALNAMTASLLLEERNHGIRATAICPGEVATPILDQRPVPVSTEDKGRMLQSEDLGELILYVAKQPPHVTLNEILITPTWNRFAAR